MSRSGAPGDDELVEECVAVVREGSSKISSSVDTRESLDLGDGREASRDEYAEDSAKSVEEEATEDVTVVISEVPESGDRRRESAGEGSVNESAEELREAPDTEGGELCGCPESGDRT